jgi:hypothetical protein
VVRAHVAALTTRVRRIRYGTQMTYAVTVAEPEKVAFQPVAGDPSAGTAPLASIGPENTKFLVPTLIEPPPPMAVSDAGHWTDTVSEDALAL